LVPAEASIESSEAPESAGDDAQSVDAQAETTQSETESEAVDDAVSPEGTTTPEPGDVENR
jgi:hypothetical protein